MKKLLLLTIVLLTAISGAWADGACGENATWSVADGVLTISGSGAINDYNTNEQPWKDSDVNMVVIGADITSIGNYAFSCFSSLEELIVGGDSWSSKTVTLGTNSLPASVSTIYVPESRLSSYQSSWSSYASKLKPYGGMCGNAVIWTFSNHVLTLTGMGEMRNDFGWWDQPWGNRANIYYVVIDKRITLLGKNCFASRDYDNVKMVIVESTTPAVMGGEGDDFIQPYGRCYIYVPNSSLSTYKTSWSDLADYIKGYEGGTTDNGVTWVLDSEGKMLVLGSGTMDDYTLGNLSTTPWYNYRSDIRSVEIMGSKVGSYAFSNCENLTSVNVDVQTIGANAFSNCPNLSYANVNTQTITADPFSNCSKLSLNLDVQTIGANAFSNNTGLKTVTIGKNVTTIGEGAFSGCTSLKCAVIMNTTANLAAIGSGAFPANDGFEVLVYRTRLSNYQSAEGWAAYASYLTPFDGFSRNTYPTDENNGVVWQYDTEQKVLTIDGCGYVYDSNCPLQDINGSTVYEIHPSIERIIIGSGITSFDGRNLYEMENVISYTVDEANPYFCSEDGLIFSKDKTTLVAYPGGKTDETYTVPSTVTTIGNTSFSRKNHLVTVTVPNGFLENYAFSQCKNLETLILGAGFTGMTRFGISDCPKVSVHLAEGNTAFVEENGVIYDAAKTDILYFPMNYSGAYVIPNTVSISRDDDSNFYNYTFRNHKALTSITIGAGLSAMPDFYGCDNLTEILIADGHPNLSDDNGIIYNAERTQILYFPKTYYGAYVIPNTVTEANYDLFSNCKELTSLTIGTGIEWFGFNDLYGCDNLKEVHVADGNPRYCSEDGVVFDVDKTRFYYFPKNYSGAYVIPNTVKYLLTGGPGTDITFKNCKGLTSLTIGAGLTEFPNLEGCDNLTEILIADGNERFYNENGIVYSKASPNEYPYQTNTMIEWMPSDELIIPASMTTVPQLVSEKFAPNIKKVTISEGVQEIGDRAFSYLGLTGIEIPNTVTSIGESAFYGCSNLTSIEIPNSVTSIGRYAFVGCSNLTSIEIPNSVTSIPEGCFMSSGLTSIKIPNSVTSIGYQPFRDCRNLTGTIKIPSSVTSISGGLTFMYTKCQAVVISPGLTTIFDSFFEYMNELKTIVLPSTITAIDVWGTSIYCPKLENVVILAPTPPTLNVYYGLYLSDETKIFVPSSAVDAYKSAANWPSDRIYGFTDIDLSSATIKEEAFSGEAITPKVVLGEAKMTISGLAEPMKVDLGGIELEPGTDFTGGTLTAQTNVGSYPAGSITAASGSPYIGSTSDLTFTINKADLSNVTITGVTPYIDLGEEMTQNLTLKLGNSYTLTADDYDMELQNTDAVGTATIRLTGKGDKFTGTNTNKRFDVTRRVELNPAYDYLTYYAAEDLEIPSGYTARTITDANLQTGKLSLSNFLTYIPQETAVILHKMGTAQGTYHLRASTGNAPMVFAGFKGVLQPTPKASLEGDVQYILAGNEFLKISDMSGGNLAANRCYLAFDNVLNAPARLQFVETEDTTPLMDITTTDAAPHDGWYTLDGRKLNGMPTKKGLYVRDGVKIVIK